MGITHAKHSDKSDGADTSLVRPSDWNADHVGALDDLDDVNAPSPADGDALVWDDATSKWVSGGVKAENVVQAGTLIAAYNQFR